MRINKILVHLICIVLLILIILLIYYNISNKKEHFTGHSNKHKKHHYCAVDGKCVKSIKNCGKNILDIKIDSYPTESICNNYVDKCQKYNSNPQQKSRNRRVEITFLAPVGGPVGRSSSNSEKS